MRNTIILDSRTSLGLKIAPENNVAKRIKILEVVNFLHSIHYDFLINSRYMGLKYTTVVKDAEKIPPPTLSLSF